MISEITKKAPRSEATADGNTMPAAAPLRAASSFWSFMKTFFVGTAGLALLAVIGTLAGSAWLTANQRAEAEKAEPWTNPSFTTTAVTTGGMLARWTDNDGNLENGHTYVKGIYDLWKAGAGKEAWRSISASHEVQASLPQLWQFEFNRDAELRARAAAAEADKAKHELEKTLRQNRLGALGANL